MDGSELDDLSSGLLLTAQLKVLATLDSLLDAVLALN
jgi:hypothetical protein